MKRNIGRGSVWMSAIVLMTLAASSAGPSPEATGDASTTSGTTSAAETGSGQQPPDIPNDTRCPSSTKIAQETLKTGSTVSPAASWGSGTIGVLLLHQTDGDGMCGWLAHTQSFKDLADDARFLTFDLCGYGQAKCAGTEANQRRQITAAVDRLHENGAQTVVILGASLGGYLAVHFGSVAGADSIISLSGYGMAGVGSFLQDLERTWQPVLLATSHADSESRYKDLQGEAKATGKDFAGFDTGHGYTMLPEAKETLEKRIRQAAEQTSPSPP